MIDNVPLLVGKDLFLSYLGSDVPAINGISFSLCRGELCGLIGPNGAGKTTLISVFTTLLRPQRGSLHIAGINAIGNPAGVRSKIGFVPQDLALYDRLTGLENIDYFGSMYDLDRKLLREKAKNYLEMFGLYDKRDRQVATYSGGMKRRINLIIGIIHDPELLFLDEPTVGIDAQSRHMILEKLAALNSEQMAMLYTSHYLEEVQSLCRRVVIIDEGRIIAEDTPKNLIAQAEGCGSLAEIFLQKTGEHLRD
ncbi:MAG: ABC transporter ATP-binding protein [Proteobacteria bacterium]|nr:ABC transporter ATP-binding protein [Pseudomonadota bacterium]